MPDRDHPDGGCVIVLVAAGFLITGVALTVVAIFGLLAGVLTYAGLWLAAFAVLIGNAFGVFDRRKRPEVTDG